MDWTDHIENLSAKLNKVSYCFRIVLKYLNENAKRTLYFANFEAILRFGIIFWASNSKIQNIFTIQKRVIRIMYKMSYLQTCRGVFRNKNIMTVVALYIFDSVLFFYKNRDRFNTSIQHEHNTRSYNIIYPIHRLTLLEKSAYYMCIKFFNKLPLNIKQTINERMFKKNVKQLLIELEPYSVDDYLSM